MLPAFKNFAEVEVSTGYDASATTIVLKTGDGAKLPSPSTDGNFYLTWWNWTLYKDICLDPNKEKVLVTGRSGDTLTVTRGQRGTSAATHNTASCTYWMAIMWDKEDIDEIKFVMNEVPSGTINGSNVTFTSAYNMLTGNIHLYLNGTKLLKEGTHYTISNKTITMTSAPLTGETLLLAMYKVAP